MRESEQLEAWRLIEELREHEGDSVNVICDNPDGPPNSAIECNGGWTGWSTKTFNGENVLECLRSAAKAKRAVGDDVPEPGSMDVHWTPFMDTLQSTFVVKRPEAELAAPQIGRHGGMSLGAHHLPGVGAVMSVAIHHKDGTTLISTFGFEGYCEVGHEFNRWGARIQAGEFDKPETPQ